MELNSLNSFCRASPKEHPCQVSSRLAQWFRRRRCLKKLWPDARHRAITIAHSEHFLLRQANNNAIQLVAWEEKIFNLFFLLWLPEFFMEHNYLKEFERGPPKEHSCEIW